MRAASVAALALVLAACGSSEPLVREAPPAEITIPSATPEPTATARPRATARARAARPGRCA